MITEVVPTDFSAVAGELDNVKAGVKDDLALPMIGVAVVGVVIGLGVKYVKRAKGAL